jgi:5-methylthioadenosine/S-adenosylhomocysteine deaminase
VSHVWVNGKMLVKDKQLTTLDTLELYQRAMFWQKRIGVTDNQ